MAENSEIGWTDHTFNPWIGCTRISPACDHCYAADLMDVRYNRVKWGAGEPRARTSEGNWKKPLQWNRNAANFMKEFGRRQRVFCASLADVFDNEVDQQWRTDLFQLIVDTPHLDWLLLTKRIGNVDKMVEASGLGELPRNVWLGATICNQEEADRDVLKLLAVSATIRFLSMEPLLSSVDLREFCGGHYFQNPLTGQRWHDATEGISSSSDMDGELIHWIIAGGESGALARAADPAWFRSLRDQCRAADTPFFFKQWGEFGAEGKRMGKTKAGYELDGQVIQQFPV